MDGWREPRIAPEAEYPGGSCTTQSTSRSANTEGCADEVSATRPAGNICVHLSKVGQLCYIYQSLHPEHALTQWEVEFNAFPLA